MWSHYLDSDPLGGTVASVYRSLLVVLKQLPLMTAMYTRDEQTFGKYLSRPGSFFGTFPPDPGPTRDFLQAMQEIGVVRQDINIRAVAFILDALTPSILAALSSHKRESLEDSTRPDQPSFDELVETVAELCERLLAPKKGANLEAGKALMHRRVNELKPWLKEPWCLPRRASGECVACMEDVLRVYQRPYEARFPQVCLDETSKQLAADVRDVVPMQPGQPERQDFQ